MKSSFTLKSLPRRTSKVLFTLPSARLRRTGKATCCPARDRVDPFYFSAVLISGHKVEHFFNLKSPFLTKESGRSEFSDHKDSFILG